MFKRLFVGFSILLLMVFSLTTFAMEKINFGKGFISDSADIINYGDENLLNIYLWDLHNKTTADIAVVTLNSLDNQNVNDKAMYINRAFRVGAVGKDNGVVIVISPDENKIAIDTGYNLDNAIPDIRKKQIINDIMLPQFEKENYSKGVYDGVTVLAIDIANFYNKKLTGLEYTKVPPIPKTFIQKITPVNWTVAILLFILGILLYIKKREDSFESYAGFGDDFRSLDK